jgi:23S rRNA pseudouridine1911/1915/1917 synthase
VSERADERLDRHLVRMGFAPSRRAAAEMVARGDVRINGRRASKGTLVSARDRVEVARAHRITRIEPDPEAALSVLYEDDEVLVVHKPGGMACHPLRAGERGTLMNAVVARYPETADAGEMAREGGLVHRLDNGTSGALIIARSIDAFRRLRAVVRAGAFERRYEALIAGHLSSTLELSEPIAHHPRSARRMVAAGRNRKATGRAAKTRVEPIRHIGGNTLVAVIPQTGRRHQIRVHLSEAGHPIVGDTLYGGPKSRALAPGRFWLHLAEVGFESPAAGPVVARAPLPDDLRALID